MTQNPTLSEREAKALADAKAKRLPGSMPWYDKEIIDLIVSLRAPVAPAEPVAEDVSSLIAARCVALPGPLIDCPVCGAVDKERARLEAGGVPLPHCSEDATSAQPSTVTADGWKDVADALMTALADERDYTLKLRALLDRSREYVTDAVEAHRHDDGVELLAEADTLLANAATPAPSPVTGALVAALEGFDDDYMTSETHHPGYVLIPTATFERIRAALAAQKAEG